MTKLSLKRDSYPLLGDIVGIRVNVNTLYRIANVLCLHLYFCLSKCLVGTLKTKHNLWRLVTLFFIRLGCSYVYKFGPCETRIAVWI